MVQLTCPHPSGCLSLLINFGSTPHFYGSLPDYSYDGRPRRVEELLRSNASLHDSEKPSLQEILFQGRDYAQLQKKIAATRTLLEYLKAQKERMMSVVSDAQALLRPLRDVPDDMDGIRLNSDSLDIRKAPWTVSRVCCQWRTVAFTAFMVRYILFVHTPEFPSSAPARTSIETTARSP
ncbi:hypothetical protein DFS33DRAFT_533709 [Desarmillaria ectypa]|nr:hypothetical protein DFS33DRAFT_533709 [Desarmillaria ectypa]